MNGYFLLVGEALDFLCLVLTTIEIMPLLT